MTTIGDQFASALHQCHLKPLGFRKVRKNYTRTHADYTEHYQIQGSAWNDSSSPWVFYLNCGISFSGLPVPLSGHVGTHGSTRAPVFTGLANAQDEVTPDTMSQVAEHTAEVIREVSAYFARRHAFLRDCYEHRRFHHGFFADPELRNWK
jgi:hypothetical protein